MNEELVHHNPRVAFRPVADGGVLLHLTSGQYHGVNATGALIWNHLAEPSTPADVATALRGEFSSAPADLDEIVTAFIHHLATLDLVVA